MRKAVLPFFLRPRPTEQLIRLGRQHDGGYLVDGRDIAASDVLLGFGIRDDWSFESDFVKRHPIPVYAFDPTVNSSMFFHEMKKALRYLNHPSQFLRAYQTWSNYRTFFRGDHHHIEKFVGASSWDNSVSVADIRKDTLPAALERLFFKIDIEGWEYRILDDLLELAPQVTGLVIEFHDVDLHLDRIQDFIERLPLNLCHVHGNNYGPLSHDKIPTVIECTWTRQTDGKVDYQLPHAMDAPNNPYPADYAISFLPSLGSPARPELLSRDTPR
jgi:hypothetical protein